MVYPYILPAAARRVTGIAGSAALNVGGAFIIMARKAAARYGTVIEGCRTPAAPRDVALSAVVAALYMGGSFSCRRPGVVALGTVAGNGGVVHLDELKPAVLRVALVALTPGLDVSHGLVRRGYLAALRMAAVTLLRRALEGAADVTALAPCRHMGAEEDKAGRIVVDLCACPPRSLFGLSFHGNGCLPRCRRRHPGANTIPFPL